MFSARTAQVRSEPKGSMSTKRLIGKLDLEHCGDLSIAQCVFSSYKKLHYKLGFSAMQSYLLQGPSHASHYLHRALYL